MSTMAVNSRRAEVERNTKETQIRVAVDLDGSGTSRLATGIGFLITCWNKSRGTVRST